MINGSIILNKLH